LVAGLLMSDGTFQDAASYYLPNGTLSASQEGNFSVNVLDSSGNILSQTTNQVDFEAYLNPIGRVSTDSVPVVISVPFSMTAANVELVFNDSVVSSYSPNASALITAIQSIPDQGFEKNPTQMRNALLNKAQAFKNALAARSNQGARNMLENDIRKSVSDWVLD